MPDLVPRNLLSRVGARSFALQLFGPRVRELWQRGWQVHVWQFPDGTYEFHWENGTYADAAHPPTAGVAAWEVWDRMFMLRTDDLVLAVDNFNHMYWEIMLLVPQVQIPCR